MDEPTLQESIATLLAKTPPPVQQYVLNELSDKVHELMRRHDLHIDQAGVLQGELLLMLVGQGSPTEFMQEMRAAGVGEDTLTALIRDVNEEIFKIIRSREVGEDTMPAPRAQQAPNSPQRPPAAPVQERQPLEGAPPAAPQPVYAPPFPGAQQQTYWVPVSITAVPQPYMTTTPPPQYQVPQQPPAPPPTPAPIPEPPRVEERPAPPPPIPAWEPPAPPPNLPTHENSFSPITKDYAADPYREPI